ncbi:hypothetical protein [Halalkalibacter urbisdiaboli]|uniref:hypothetical protein n=1 Tax=Halalkalibacter urbisdiaboli TaxID=1960589 RepID=UPI003159D7A3
MNIEEIIKELIFNKIIHNEPTEYKQLIGGTVSELYLLKFDGFKYVVKLNEPKVIESEAKFLNYYNESNLLPKLLYAEQSYKYIVYSYINGSTNYDRKNKKQMLKVLVQGLLNNYKSSPNDFGWGWADQPVDTWQSFLMDEIIETKKILDSRLDI